MGWLALASCLLTSTSARAEDEAGVEVIILEVTRGDEAAIDRRIAEDEPIVQSLAAYNRIRVIDWQRLGLRVGRETTLDFRTPNETPATLRLTLLERTDDRMKLRVRCKALQDLDTTTTHKDGGTFLVVRPQSSVGVAIRRRVSPG